MAVHYRLLEEEYEKEHRGRMIAEGTELHALWIRGHSVKEDIMKSDERYTPYIRRAKLIAFVTMARRGLTTYNGAALTALIDRWHAETHSFHLLCGEMTITLQDMAMVTALPIKGEAVTGKIESGKYRDMVEELLGVRPPDPMPDKKGSKTGGLKFTWLQQHFHEPPDGADEPTIERYARAYVLYVFGTVLFEDSGGSSASWMFLPLLRDWDEAGRYSWGSAGLAFLYRQLDEACRRSSGTSNIGGCVLLFQIWMWERLSVGRPISRTRRDWEYDEPDRLPTVTHCLDEVRTNWGKTEDLYMSYTNELDCLLPSHVQWLPYNQIDFQLNVVCTQDESMWSVRCPLICFYAVEFHLPHRVVRQFGRLQLSPPETISTSIELHKLDRQKNKRISDWRCKHQEYIDVWNVGNMP
nr:serine/threonine-protein phosphatase 7 long form homolog [Aegilops tauschii subsp. strangulata]